MALVPQSTYTAWFSRTSWVYRSFAFLFQNPLFTKPVPRGSSLCVFWWSALFSLFVFRPAVYMTLGLRGVSRALRLDKAIRFTDSVSPFPGPFGLPTVCGLVVGGLILTMLGLLISIVGTALFECWEHGVLSCVVLPALNLVVFSCCLGYAKSNEGNPDRCKVEVYSRITLGLSVLTAALLQPTLFVGWFLGTPGMLLGYLWAFITWMAVGFWGAITWIFAGMAAGLPHLWIGGLFLTGLLIYGWLVVRFGWTMGGPLPEVTQPKLSKEDIDANLSHIADAISEQTDCPYAWTVIRSAVKSSPECLDLARSAFKLTCEQVLSLAPVVYASIEALRKRQAARSETCKRVTAALARLCTPIVALWKQLRIAASYLWTFAKTRKSGVCPYLTFQD